MDALALVVFLAACFGAAAIGGALTVRSLRDWYPTLAKPPWTPPDRLFGPVWTLLYALMAVAAWLVWRARDAHDVSIALGLFALQLALNVGWSLAFFGRRDVRAGLVVIALLLTTIAATTIAFLGIDPLAAGLFVPYLAWVAFATALNAAIARRAERA